MYPPPPRHRRLLTSFYLWAAKAKYAANTYFKYNVSMATVKAFAWETLTRLVEQSDMPHKEEAVDVLRNVPETTYDSRGVLTDSRRKHLMELQYGRTWRYMEKHFFPGKRSRAFERSSVSGGAHVFSPKQPRLFGCSVVFGETTAVVRSFGRKGSSRDTTFLYPPTHKKGAFATKTPYSCAIPMAPRLTRQAYHPSANKAVTSSLSFGR